MSTASLDGQVSRGAYILGGLSFIPLIGIPSGLIALLWGLLTQRQAGRAVAFMGAGGLLFSLLPYGSLYYWGFVKQDTVFDDLRAKMARHNLTVLLHSVEFYRIQHGTYPLSLAELRNSLPEDQRLYLYEPFHSELENEKPPYLYYQLLENGETYYLLSSGKDKEPMTPDDIYPDVESGKTSVGLRIPRSD